MTPEDIRKCKKNGYVWLDNCGIIIRVNKGSCLWPEKNQWGILCFHATRAAAQAAIDERVAKHKADAAHAKMLEDGKTQMTPITPEQAKMLREGDEFFYLQHGGGAAKYHVTFFDKLKRSPDITKWKCFVNGLAYFTRAAAQAAIDERVAKHKADAAHAKMLEDGKTQMTPITPEQAKMLREGDEFFYLQHGGGAPKYHVTLDKLKRSPDITKWKCFVNGLAYFTHEAALATVANRETPFDSSQKWIERKIGDIIQVGDEVTDWKDGERIIAGKSIAGLPVKSSMTARYVNPLWVALQEAKRTPTPKCEHVDCAITSKPSDKKLQPKISHDDAMRYARQDHRLRQVGVPEYYRIPFGCRDILDVVIDLDHPLATAIEHLYRCRHKTSDEKARDVHKAINILERWLDAGTLKTPCPF